MKYLTLALALLLLVLFSTDANAFGHRRHRRESAGNGCSGGQASSYGCSGGQASFSYSFQSYGCSGGQAGYQTVPQYYPQQGPTVPPPAPHHEKEAKPANEAPPPRPAKVEVDIPAMLLPPYVDSRPYAGMWRPYRRW